MKVTDVQIKRQERGFTLVELAIVLIIIGLLIGGILKGQELIGNAQITNAVTQVKGIDGAVSTFRETYNAFPGDMRNATTRIAGCNAANNCANSTMAADGRIDVAVGGALVNTAGDESYEFFQHLRAADLISGFTGAAPVGFGSSHPGLAVGGGFNIGHSTTGVNGGTAVTRAGHYLTIQGSGIYTGTPVLTGSQAARLDSKLDDGTPNTGSVIGSPAACFTAGTPATYNEGTGAGTGCNLAIRIQG